MSGSGCMADIPDGIWNVSALPPSVLQNYFWGLGTQHRFKIWPASDTYIQARDTLDSIVALLVRYPEFCNTLRP